MVSYHQFAEEPLEGGYKEVKTDILSEELQKNIFFPLPQYLTGNILPHPHPIPFQHSST
jgi:hypothetical protein